jgi:type III secretion protein R
MIAFALPDPLSLIMLTAALALAPFFAVMATSYVKLVVILSLVRNALGIQQIPPNMVLNGIAVILTVYIMAPVAQKTFTNIESELVGQSLKNMDAERLKSLLSKGSEPIHDFLHRFTSNRDKRFFVDNAERLWGKDSGVKVSEDSFFTLVPAFTVSELTTAFQIGFLLYLPFIAIDLIVSNILLAMGMMMVSPMTISLPFKLLLFVLLDGWARLIYGIVLTYTVPT